MNLKKMLFLGGLFACCAVGASAAPKMETPSIAEEPSAVAEEDPTLAATPLPRPLTGNVSPLALAAQQGNAPLIVRLLGDGAPADARTAGGATALMSAAFHNRTEAVAALLNGGADVNAADKNGWTPLMFAVSSGEGTAAAGALLDAGADANAAGKNGWTPLMLALRYDRSAAFVKKLLDRRALAAAATKDGTTAMMIACQYASDPAVVEALYAADADAVQPRFGGDCPIHFAARNTTDGATDIVAFLLNNRAGTEQTNDAGWTPLMTAARFGRLDVVETLLAAKADVNARSRDGLTALMLAACSKASNAVETAQRLLAAGADPEAADRFGRTAALVAARSAHSVEMVRFLERELISRSVGKQSAVLAVLPVCRAVKECARLVSAPDKRPPVSASQRSPYRRAASPAFLNKSASRSPQPTAAEGARRGVEAPALAAVSRSTRLLSRPSLRAVLIRSSTKMSASAKRRRLKKLSAALRRDPARVTPLMLAAVNPNDAAPQIVAYLLEKGEALEARDSEGRTALICAFRYNSSPLAAEALLNAGADPRAKIGGNGLRRLLRFNERMNAGDKKRLLHLLREKLAR